MNNIKYFAYKIIRIKSLDWTMLILNTLIHLLQLLMIYIQLLHFLPGLQINSMRNSNSLKLLKILLNIWNRSNVKIIHYNQRFELEMDVVIDFFEGGRFFDEINAVMGLCVYNVGYCFAFFLKDVRVGFG